MRLTFVKFLRRSKKGLGLFMFVLVFCHFAVAQGAVLSWDFSDCEIKDILFAVSVDTGISIVPDDTVSGKGDLKFAGGDFNLAFEAFLKSIVFSNVTGESSTKVCTPGTGTTATLVTAACEDITLSIKVGDEAVTTGSVTSITNHSLAINANDPITVTIEYATGGHRADGDFTVAFGDITLTYSSVD